MVAFVLDVQDTKKLAVGRNGLCAPSLLDQLWRNNFTCFSTHQNLMSWAWVGGSVKFLKQKLRWVGMAKKDPFSEASWINCDEPCEQIFYISICAGFCQHWKHLFISIWQNQSPSDIFKAPSLRANFTVFPSAPPGFCQHSWNIYFQIGTQQIQIHLPGKQPSGKFKLHLTSSSPIVKAPYNKFKAPSVKLSSAPSDKFKAPSVKFKFYPTCSKLHLSSSKLHPFNTTRVSAI